ncbi:hypothetical protein MGA3_09530 [Bacillus methanolicus MGA3]|nr:hypothetical protein MGA3_09530 [Bacillus methanolicus MGA3]
MLNINTIINRQNQQKETFFAIKKPVQMVEPVVLFNIKPLLPPINMEFQNLLRQVGVRKNVPSVLKPKIGGMPFRF